MQTSHHLVWPQNPAKAMSLMRHEVDMRRLERILLPAAGGVGCALARMLRLAAQLLRRPCGAATFGAAAAAAGGAAVAFAWSAPAQAATMAENRPLGGPSARHRVALTAWPINDDPCGTFSSPQELFAHAKGAGYDGLELTVDDFRKSCKMAMLSRFACCPSR